MEILRQHEFVVVPAQGSGISNIQLCQILLDHFVGTEITHLGDAGIRISHAADNPLTDLFQFHSAVQHFPDAFNGAKVAVCPVVGAVHSDLVPLGEEMFMDLLFGEGVALAEIADVAAADKVKGSLQAVLRKQFRQPQVLGDTVVIAEGDGFCFATRITHKNGNHGITPFLNSGFIITRGKEKARHRQTQEFRNINRKFFEKNGRS